MVQRGTYKKATKAKINLLVAIFILLATVQTGFPYMKIMGEPVNPQQFVSFPVIVVDLNNLSQYGEVMEDRQHGIKLVRLKTGVLLGVYNISFMLPLEELNQKAIELANTKWSVKNYINCTAVSGEPLYILLFVVPRPPTDIIIE